LGGIVIEEVKKWKGNITVVCVVSLRSKYFLGENFERIVARVLELRSY